MVNAIRHMLNNIYSQIPEEILELAFESKGPRRSIDDEIIEKVIEGRLRIDCSVFAGKFKEIILDPDWALTSYLDQINAPNVTIPYVVYKIPASARENRQIVRVDEISLPYGSQSSIAMMGGNNRTCGYNGISAGSFADQVINGVTGYSDIIVPTPILLDGSMVKLTPMEFGVQQSYQLILRCRLEYDKDFTNLSNDSVIKLSELGVTATKAYIYNKLAIKLDAGAIKSGAEIGKIREIVESYADANDRYLVTREEFHGTTTLDPETLMQQVMMGISF